MGGIILLKEKIKNDKERYNNNQKIQIEKEHKIIETLINKYISKSLLIDKKAQDLFNKETLKYSDCQNLYLKDYNFLELKIKEEYELIVKSHEVNFEKQKNLLNSEITQLEYKESAEIKKLDNLLNTSLTQIKQKIQVLEKQVLDKIDAESNVKLQGIIQKRNQLKVKEKKLLMEALENYQSDYSSNNLKQHRISDDKYSIFTDQYAEPDRIVSNLAQCGIFTAADIKGVDESGRILKANGSWVKVSDVAITRARKLDDWRRKKERLSPTTPPQTLPYSEEMKVIQKLTIEYQTLDNEEKQIKQNIQNQKSNISNQLTKHIEEAKSQEKIIIDDIQNKKINLTKIIKLDKNKAQKKLNDLLTSAVLVKKNQQDLFEKNVKPLKDKISQIQVVKDESFYIIKTEFDPYHENLIVELKQLDNLFNNELPNILSSTINDLDLLKNEYEIMLSKNIDMIKSHISVYNNLVDSLIIHQDNYSQIK